MAAARTVLGRHTDRLPLEAALHGTTAEQRAQLAARAAEIAAYKALLPTRHQAKEGDRLGSRVPVTVIPFALACEPAPLAAAAEEVSDRLAVHCCASSSVASRRTAR